MRSQMPLWSLFFACDLNFLRGSSQEFHLQEAVISFWWALEWVSFIYWSGNWGDSFNLKTNFFQSLKLSWINLIISFLLFVFILYGTIVLMVGLLTLEFAFFSLILFFCFLFHFLWGFLGCPLYSFTDIFFPRAIQFLH